MPDAIGGLNMLGSFRRAPSANGRRFALRKARFLVVLALAVLSQLEAKANWHRIAREWMYGDEPVTELGVAEARFYG